MTPPETDMPNTTTTSSIQGVYIATQDEDDVFGEDVQPRPSTAPVSHPIIAPISHPTTAPFSHPTTTPVTGREVVEHNTIHGKLAPRGDRMKEPVTPSNAQGVLPPEALVFVAKWANSTLQ